MQDVFDNSVKKSRFYPDFKFHQKFLKICIFSRTLMRARRSKGNGTCLFYWTNVSHIPVHMFQNGIVYRFKNHPCLGWKRGSDLNGTWNPGTSDVKKKTNFRKNNKDLSEDWEPRLRIQTFDTLCNRVEWFSTFTIFEIGHIAAYQVCIFCANLTVCTQGAGEAKISFSKNHRY